MSTTGAAASPPTPSAEAEGEHEHHDAFISYSHVDAEFAESVRSALEARDTDVWIDESDIPSGSRWREELERAIETSDAFVFLLSPASAASEHCRRELAHAVELNKRILPVRVRETPEEGDRAVAGGPAREPHHRRGRASRDPQTRGPIRIAGTGIGCSPLSKLGSAGALWISAAVALAAAAHQAASRPAR
jgi:hypothetical protein